MMKMTCVLVLMLAVVGTTYGAFYDDFSYVMGTDLVDQGGWVTCYNPANGAAQPSLVQSDIKVYDGNGWNDGAYVLGGAARDVSADVVGGKYEMTVTMHGQEFTYGSVLRLTIGDAGITDTNPANHLTFMYDSRYEDAYLYRHAAGTYEYVGGAVPFRDMETGVFRHQLKITVDLGANSASAYFQDLDDDNGFAPMGWEHIGDWSFDLPMASITQAGIASSNYKYFYDFKSVPEPMTMTLLGVGGLLLARRRRK